MLDYVVAEAGAGVMYSGGHDCSSVISTLKPFIGWLTQVYAVRSHRHPWLCHRYVEEIVQRKLAAWWEVAHIIPFAWNKMNSSISQTDHYQPKSVKRRRDIELLVARQSSRLHSGSGRACHGFNAGPSFVNYGSMVHRRGHRFVQRGITSTGSSVNHRRDSFASDSGSGPSALLTQVVWRERLEGIGKGSTSIKTTLPWHCSILQGCKGHLGLSEHAPDRCREVPAGGEDGLCNLHVVPPGNLAMPEPVQRREDPADYGSVMMPITKLGMPALQKLGFGLVASRRVRRSPQPPSEHADADDISSNNSHSSDDSDDHLYRQEPTTEGHLICPALWPRLTGDFEGSNAILKARVVNLFAMTQSLTRNRWSNPQVSPKQPVRCLFGQPGRDMRQRSSHATASSFKPNKGKSVAVLLPGGGLVIASLGGSDRSWNMVYFNRQLHFGRRCTGTRPTRQNPGVSNLLRRLIPRSSFPEDVATFVQEGDLAPMFTGVWEL
ncbi:hypothetical protein FSST1_009598 [Fusarium sambucinum]